MGGEGGQIFFRVCKEWSDLSTPNCNHLFTGQRREYKENKTRPGVICAEVCNSPGNIPSFQGVSGGKGEDGTVQYLVVLGQNVAVLDGTGSALGNTGWDMVIMGHLAR